MLAINKLIINNRVTTVYDNEQSTVNGTHDSYGKHRVYSNSKFVIFSSRTKITIEHGKVAEWSKAAVC